MTQATQSDLAPLFENAAWAVTPDGLEHKGNGYFIARDCLGERRSDGSWAWPQHMAEKSWVDAASFGQAFLRALDHHGLAADAALAPSLVSTLDAGPKVPGTQDATRIGDAAALIVAHCTLEQARRLPVRRRKLPDIRVEVVRGETVREDGRVVVRLVRRAGAR